MDTAMSKNSAAISDLPFPVKKVSPEIRMMIYAYNLIIQHDDKRPALLVALDGDKDYQEAYMLYKRNADVAGEVTIADCSDMQS